MLFYINSVSLRYCLMYSSCQAVNICWSVAINGDFGGGRVDG